MHEDSTQLACALRAEGPKLLACVHCGLCLESCPTYVHTSDENDSPRGRIYLMRAVDEGRLALSSHTFTRHIDRCLGCRACESACPAGVEYGQLLEAARADIYEGGRKRGWTSRTLRFALRHVWLRPARLRLAFTLARAFRDSRLPRLILRTKASKLLPSRAEFALALLDSSSPAPMLASVRGSEGAAVESNDARAAAPTAEAGSVALLFEGCVTEGLFARVNRATERVLAANGCAARRPRGQVCCGALHAHAGDLDGARTLARRNVEAFGAEEGAPVVTNAGGCGAMLVSYAHLLADDAEYAERARAFSARVRDVSQQLAATGVREAAPLDGLGVTYDASCHLLHGQGARVEPLRMLGSIPGLKLSPLEGADVCCGGAGVYNLMEEELSARVLEEKLRRVAETGALVLATGNPGCHMQLGAGARLRGMRLAVCHPVELLEESYRRAGLGDGG
ncbi:MAG TPA: heterodisulfide reductase-related iron-sulfur binding cluster [Pyrinomonadaceae bacterium]|nr:heterodisulfide reductase-related iron-sulfur binding cluster [Pyrinomonadaceae bacterium]